MPIFGLMDINDNKKCKKGNMTGVNNTLGSLGYQNYAGSEKVNS